LVWLLWFLSPSLRCASSPSVLITFPSFPPDSIGRFYLIGGCDGASGERSYFTELAREIKKTPDGVILTLGCGKFRVMDEDLGDIKGVPRVLDIGQCNDSYGAVKIASALADAFKTDVNGLPLSFMVSWFEQKAISVLLTLLHLKIKGRCWRDGVLCAFVLVGI
jgi:hydroxylamine reductase